LGLEGEHLIDQITTLTIVATQGICEVYEFFPTDENNYIYGIPNNYTMTLECNHDVEPDYGLKILLPKDDWYVIDNNRCTVGLMNNRYSCEANNTLGQVLIRDYTDVVIKAKNKFTLTFDSIMNPGHFDQTGTIFVESVTEVLGKIDEGNFTMADNYFIKSNVTDFTVEVLDTGVGAFPVTYKFLVTTAGEVWKKGYFIINIPPEISVSNEREMERKCGTNLKGFTYSNIHCKLNGNKLIIENGFKQSATANLTDDGDLIPPTFEFEIDWFRNPRTTAKSSPWNITVYSREDDILY